MDGPIKAYSDIFVKYLMGSEENKDLLISFINVVHKDFNFSTVVDVELKNPFNIKSCATDKVSILDIKARDETGRLYYILIFSPIICGSIIWN
jgi:predicted transposase/invertase (TIGR01784 family)